MYLKPLYKDYKTQAANRLFKNRPMQSGGKLFEFADRAMIIAGEIIIVAAILVLRWFCPSKYGWIYEGVLYIALIASVWGFCTLYLHIFVYRYGRFRVEWEDRLSHIGEPASEYCTPYGDFLKTKENRIYARKSRLQFLGLFAGIAAFVFLAVFLTWGLAEARVRGDDKIDGFIDIAKKYDEAAVYISGNKENACGVLYDNPDIEMSEEDQEKLKSILRDMQWNYVSRLDWRHGKLTVSLLCSGSIRDFYIEFPQKS